MSDLILGELGDKIIGTEYPRYLLKDNFVSSYKNVTPPWDHMGEFVYYRTYSRYIEHARRNEQWHETIERVVTGVFNIQKKHCLDHRLPWSDDKAHESSEIMFDKMFNFKFTPPGRGLFLMGTRFIEERGGGGLNSCGFVSTDDMTVRGPYAFSWTMDALMLGVGVGFDTKGAGSMEIKSPTGKTGLMTIPDTREGWVDATLKLLESYFYKKEPIDFDYSKIRPAGLPIKGFGGVSSGPEPLIAMHDRFRELLDTRVNKPIKSTDIVDIMNMIGCCVVAGNVRRSAEVALGDANDEEYVNMKDPHLFAKELNERRWASNNALFVEVGKTKYSKFVKNIGKNGEPGFIWLDNIQGFGRMADPKDYVDSAAKGVNPCVEQTLESYELCCLSETYPANHDNYEDFQKTIKMAYHYTKSVTLVPTHWPETNAIMLKNRRIGVSQTGIIDAMTKHGRRVMIDWSDKGYHYIKKLDKVYSDWLCIPRSIKVTTVKPSGSVSLLAGCTPGIHYPFAEYYIRRVRVAANSNLAVVLGSAGFPWEYSVYGKTDEEKRGTMVFSFPMHKDNYDRSEEEVSIWEQIKNVVDYQKWWSDNNVSCTVKFKPHEVEDIAKALECYEDSLKAISFLPMEHGYKQAPMEKIEPIMGYECTTCGKYHYTIEELEKESSKVGFEIIDQESFTITNTCYATRNVVVMKTPKEIYEVLVGRTKRPDYSSIITQPEGEKYCSNDSCTI